MKPSKEEVKKVAEALLRCPEILEVVIKVSLDTLKIIAPKEKNTIQVFCSNMLLRIHCASEGLLVLLKKYIIDHRKFDFSIGIVMRSALLDYIIMLNIAEIINRNSGDANELTKELNEFCLRMLSDTAYHSLKYFKNNREIIPPGKLKSMYSRLVELHELSFEHYEHDGSEPKLKSKERPLTQKELVNRLKASKDLSHLALKEDWYMFYSKYDHFGEMYYNLSSQPISREFSHIDLALREFPRSLVLMIMLLHFLYPDNKEIMEQLNIAKEYAEKIVQFEEDENNK